MSEEIKKLFEDKTIEYWKIGTGFSSYKKSILNWLNDREILDNISKIEINKKQVSINEKNTKIFESTFNLFPEKIVYIQKDEKKQNEYTSATIDQFLTVLKYLGILFDKENETKYCFSNSFVEFANHILQKEEFNVEEELDKYLSKIVNEKLMPKLENIISTFEGYSMDVDKNQEINFIFSIWLDGLRYIVDKENLYIYLKNDFLKICHLKKQGDSYYKEIGKLISKEKIKEIAKIFKEHFGISNEEVNSILSNNPSLEEQKNNFVDIVREENQYKSKSELISVFDFFDGFKEGFYIPIFQRAYVWNDEAIKMMIKSIIIDMENGNISYLNNIIVMFNEHDRRNIVDGQQRLFTIILILYSLMKIMLSSESQTIPMLFKDLFLKNDFSFIKNCDEIDSCSNFKKIIKAEMDNEVNEELKQKDYWKLSTIVAYIKNNVKDIEKFKNHILMNTTFTLTNLKDKNDLNKIFANLNTIQKTLNALDLVRNNIYSQTKEELNNNNFLNQKNINDIISFFNEKIFNSFSKENKNKDEIDNDLLTLFIENLTFLLHHQDTTFHESFTNKDLNKEVSNAYRLNEIIDFFIQNEDKIEPFKKIISYFERKNNNNANSNSLFKFKVYKALILLNYFLNIFLYIKKGTELENSKIYISGLFAYNQAIKAAQWGNKTVVIPLIWAICDKFNVFNILNTNTNNEQKLIEESTKWLFEIERFNVFWNETSFSGQSLSSALFNIAEKIRKDQNYKIKTFKNDLLNTIEKLSEFDSERKNKELKEKLENKYMKLTSKTNVETTKLYLSRINFFLNNHCKMFFNFKYANSGTYEYKIFNPNNKLDLEHNSPQKRDKNSKIIFNQTEKEFDDEYKEYVQKIGNLSLLTSIDNKKQGNRDQSKKETKNCPEYLKITKGYSEADDNNNKYNDDKKDKIELCSLQINNDNWENIKKHIDERSRQLINIILRMYSYKEEKDEESTN